MSHQHSKKSSSAASPPAAAPPAASAKSLPLRRTWSDDAVFQSLDKGGDGHIQAVQVQRLLALYSPLLFAPQLTPLEQIILDTRRSGLNNAAADDKAASVGATTGAANLLDRVARGGHSSTTTLDADARTTNLGITTANVARALNAVLNLGNDDVISGGGDGDEHNLGAIPTAVHLNVIEFSAFVDHLATYIAEDREDAVADGRRGSSPSRLGRGATVRAVGSASPHRAGSPPPTRPSTSAPHPPPPTADDIIRHIGRTVLMIELSRLGSAEPAATNTNQPTTSDSLIVSTPAAPTTAKAAAEKSYRLAPPIGGARSGASPGRSASMDDHGGRAEGRTTADDAATSSDGVLHAAGNRAGANNKAAVSTEILDAVPTSQVLRVMDCMSSMIMTSTPKWAMGAARAMAGLCPNKRKDGATLITEVVAILEAWLQRERGLSPTMVGQAMDDLGFLPSGFFFGMAQKFRGAVISGPTSVVNLRTTNLPLSFQKLKNALTSTPQVKSSPRMCDHCVSLKQQLSALVEEAAENERAAADRERRMQEMFMAQRMALATDAKTQREASQSSNTNNTTGGEGNAGDDATDGAAQQDRRAIAQIQSFQRAITQLRYDAETNAEKLRKMTARVDELTSTLEAREREVESEAQQRGFLQAQVEMLSDELDKFLRQDSFVRQIADLSKQMVNECTKVMHDGAEERLTLRKKAVEEKEAMVNASLLQQRKQLDEISKHRQELETRSVALKSREAAVTLREAELAAARDRFQKEQREAESASLPERQRRYQALVEIEEALKKRLHDVEQREAAVTAREQQTRVADERLAQVQRVLEERCEALQQSHTSLEQLKEGWRDSLLREEDLVARGGGGAQSNSVASLPSAAAVRSVSVFVGDEIRSPPEGRQPSFTTEVAYNNNNNDNGRGAETPPNQSPILRTQGQPSAASTARHNDRLPRAAEGSSPPSARRSVVMGGVTRESRVFYW